MYTSEDFTELLKKKRKIKKQLLEGLSDNYIEKHIAILGGSTTSEIKDMLEIFLLEYGIKPVFYESEYNMYFTEGAFKNEALLEFKPDFIYIHTTSRNITHWPEVSDTAEMIEDKLKLVKTHFMKLWDFLDKEYGCSIIQNNFEMPYYRLLGNQDVVYPFGYSNFVMKLNLFFSDYAYGKNNFYIHDIQYEASTVGLDKWTDIAYWSMYKYAMSRECIPYTAYNVALIIKSLMGRNKKALSLDLDNTLWGGVIGDDGAENINIGYENAIAESYTEFQKYIKKLKEIGIILTVNSKNDESNAVKGFERPDSTLKKEDFLDFRANWEPKCNNLIASAKKINIMPDSFVFVDDNPAEREIVRQSVSGVEIPAIDNVENYVRAIDKAGYFEVTNLSADDLKRNSMYVADSLRLELEEQYTDYNEYLLSLEMKAEIKTFAPVYMARIAQLTNKSNQYNLTTRRYTQKEIEDFAVNENYMTLYGKLVDKFGDNGVVSVVIGERKDNRLDINLWLMSCRVLKRDMEYAMMDTVADYCMENGITEIRGYYYPTAKNGMVKNFYELQGFDKISEDEEGNTVWKLVVTDSYENKNKVIKVN